MSLDTHTQTRPDTRAFRSSTVDQHLIAGKKTFLGYLRRRLGSLDEAEDLLQSFSLKVIRAGQPAGREEKINAWMGQILRNTLIDHYRRRAVRQRAETAYVLEQNLTEPFVEADQDTPQYRCLYAALRRLRTEHAAILRRADLDEEPRGRIAADLGLTANALNVRLHRARQALRQELESCCPACRNGRFQDCACD